MAKRLIDWAVKGTTLVMGKYIDAETPSTDLMKFDMAELFPLFNEFNEVQQFLIVYGLKQKLADCGSGETDADIKAELAEKMYVMFKAGEFKAPRANATGAKENKKIADAIREVSKVVSLDGLLIKKSQFPDTFTEDDQKKLNEFLQRVAQGK